MSDTLYRVAVSKDGRTESQDYSEADYNSNVIPYLESNYNPDDYSVARLSSADEDNLDDNAQYLVTATNDGGTQEQIYDGADLKTKLGDIRNMFPGQYKVRSIEGAVRRQAEADNTPAEDDWQGRLKQQTSGMAEMTASQMDRISDMANTPDLAEQLARQDAMKDLADSTVANVYKQVETTDEEGNTAEEWQLRTAEELQAFQQARDEERTQKAELRDILAQLKEIDDIDKKDTERWNAIVMDENGDGEVSEEEINRFAWDSSKRHQRKAELSRRLNENKYYREEYDSRMALAEKVKKEAQPVIDAQLRISGPKALGEYNYNEDKDRATIEGRDTDALRAARFFANQTEKTLKAADDDTNGFMSFLQGAGATFSDADFWAFGLSSIVNNLKVKDAFDKIADKVQGAYSDESLKQYAEEGDFDKILSPDEVLMIQSFVNASQAQALRAYNTRGLYDSGKIAAESIGFMAQFLATGGVGKAASSGVTKFANWLTTKAISSAVARGAGKAAQLATKGAIRLGQAIAEPAVAAIPMTLLQTGMYKGYAENLTARNDDGSLKYTYGTAILPAMRDAYKEVWSEQALTPLLGVAGKTINKTLGAAADATKVGKYLKTSVSKVTDALGNREALGILADAGFDGFLTEMGEEYLGALLESTWNKGALKDMLNWQEFGKMAAGFAPMSVLGAGASMANYVSRVNKYNKAESYIRNLLQEEVDAGRMQQEDMDAMLNRKTSTLADIGNKVSSIITPLVETRQFDEETFKALWDFAVATGEKEIAEACIKRVQSDRRIAMADIINERTGGKNIVSVVDGERTVSFVDDNGTRRYVLTDRADNEGKYLSYDENGENPRFIDAESYGGLTTMTEDQFYDSEYDALAKASEQERMQTETEQNRQSLTDAIRAGESKLSLKDANGEQREYLFSGWKGDNAVVIPVDEQGNPVIDKTTNQPVTETRSMQEVADALGMDVTVLTDAQIEQRKIDDMTAAESVVRMGNTQKGAAVEIDGVRGRLARFFARQNEDGTISYMANLVLRGKTTTIEVDKADIEALIEQRKMMTDPQKQDGKQIRKWERKDKLESDRAYSEAKARFTNPDGSVRQSAFLAEDPENFARYSDENYGKADTDATLKANQTAMAQALLQAQQALDAEADPDAKNTLRLAAEQAQARLNTINDLVARRNHDVSSDGALSEEEARQTFDGMLEMGLQEEEIQALANNNIAEAKQAIEAIPAPQITTDIQSYIKAKEEYNNLVAEQQKKIDYWNSILNAPTREYLDAMEAERNLRRQAYNLLTRIGNAQTTETQEQLMKEYSALMIDHAIAQSSADPEVAGIAADIQSNLGQTDVPVNVVTIANVLDVVKAKGISRENYNDLLRMLSLQHGKSFLSGINTGTTGFTIGGEVYLIADNCRTIESAKTTYFHERQHLINKTDTGLVNAIIANFGKDRNALLEALGKIHGTLGYESLDARSLADEISAYVMEQVLTGQDYARMLSEAGFDNNFIKLFENEQQRQQQPGFSINRYGNGNALFRTDAEGDGAENVGDVQGAAEQESDGYLPRTDDESRADAVAQGSGGQLEISEDASSPIRFSTSAAIEGAGLKYVQQDENGDFAIVFPDGRKVTGRDAIKGDDLKAIPNTVLGYMMADARAIGTITPEVEDMMWQRYADMLNAYLKSGLKENGGFENLIGKWQWLGETAYKTIASNSDKQYSFSMDITRVCKKNEAVINGIAELQKRQGYGATPAQIMDLYLESDALGYQVPCPVCYVFSRYINNGRYATVMINGQRKYGDRLADPSKLTEEERKENIAMWVEELHTQEALNDQNASAITAAKKDIKYILDQIDDISKTLSMPGKRTKKQIDNLKKKAYALDVQYKAALDVVSQGSLDSWIKQFAIKENKDGEYEDPQTGKRYSLYDDTYQGFPEEVALDLRQTATAMREYPAIQRYRNTRGAGAGKEITFVANNDLGEVAMMLGSLNVPTVTDALRADTKDKIDLKYPPNYYKLAVNAKTEEQRSDYLAKARKRFLSAHLYAQQQSLRGGQRMWSWSDNIERLAPDVFLNMFQLRLAGGALQSYSKQLEGVKLVASLGGYVNGSLMGEGIGYREVSADEIETVDGKMYVKGEDLAVTDKDGNAKALKAPVYEKDGKYYTLVFSKLIGIDAYGSNGKKGLFQLNQELDKAGNILVGMNDLHIEAAMADDRVFFIIPWHASGADSHILKQMLEYLRVNLDNWKPFDYTGVQEEKKYKADDELNKYLIEFWNNHNYESKFACGIEGGIPSGKDGKLSPQQVHYRELRDAILRGKAVQDSEGKDKYVPVEQDEKWMKEIRNDIFLNQLYNKVRGSVDSEQMTSTDTGFIYPYEYWDTESTYWTADVNGERYLEYCRRLGFKPKFCGKLDGKAEDNGNFTDNKGFWKLLIDRRMYDTRGVYQDLTVVDMQDFNPALVDPEQTAKEFEVTRVADEAGTQEIVDRVIERENNRLGGSARVNYGLTLDKAVSLYQTAKTKPAEYYSALAQTEGYVSEEEANEDRIAYRTVTDQKLIDELNSGELIEVYRAMQVIDGKLYPPMSAYINGVLREPSERGTWEESEEHPEQADENGNFLLEKGKSDDGKRKSLKAAYNPYYHTALNPINDQFSEAQNRSNMVIVKGLVPKSEIDNPYHAEKAKDSTGRVKWHKGPLAGILGQYEGKGREVILSRYFKPIDIVPESEIAEVAAGLFKDTTLEKNPLPSNVFTPALRAELEKKGFTFVETDNTGELIDKPGVTWASVYGKKGLGNAGLGERVAKGKKLTKDQIKALEFIGVKPEDVKIDNNGSLMFRTENANQSAFISNALASLDKIQMKSGNAQAWINKIQQAGGLKKEEDKWIGLTDWLKEQTGNISKENVAEYIREHQVQIEEVNYSEDVTPFDLARQHAKTIVDGKDLDELQEELEAHKESASRFDAIGEDPTDAEMDDWLKSVMLEEYGEGFSTAYSIIDGNIDYSEELYYVDPEDYYGFEREDGNRLISAVRLDYTTEDLVNKREIALVVPTIKPYNESDEIHFGDAGDGRAIAWARFGDAVDEDGNRVLVIDEIQSKRHQDGKDKGYDSVPDAPFRDSWDALAMKRMLRLAAEEGYDKIAWTSGQMQNDRYDLEKELSAIGYSYDGQGMYAIQPVDKEGNEVFTDDYSEKDLAGVVGKEMAAKIIEQAKTEPMGTIEGDNLKLQNSGMRYFYDQKLVNWMNKYGKKWGVQVTDLTLPNLENEEGWHSVDVTPEMRESVMQGQVMFRTTEQREQLFADAKKEFGTTTDMREAGYLLPDGSMLDFSDGERGTRTLDHRNIARIITDRTYDTRTEYMDDFVNEGAIRLIPESGTFSIAQQPTDSQKDILRNFIYKNNGEVDVEIYKDGHSVANPYYRERTSPQRVLNDIDAYFNEGVIPEGNEPMFRTDISPEVREEMDAIVAEAKANGTYLKAPNGADTKLTPEQWAMVRTKNFKNWFGNWENDPENASKVVDENGEPMVVYHGTMSATEANHFNVFDSWNGALWFATDEEYARVYAGIFKYGDKDIYDSKEKPMVYNSFVSIKNPFIAGSTDVTDAEGYRIFRARMARELNVSVEDLDKWAKTHEGHYDDYTGKIEEDAAPFNITGSKGFRDRLKEMGYDGIAAIESGSVTYGAFSPNQIKSATDNNGEFNPDNPDIRFRTSVTPAQDAEYMSAVEAGDMEKAQQMVETAAEMAGYNKTEGFYLRKEFEPILPSENDEWAYRYGEHLRDKYGASKRAIDWYTELDEIFEGKSVESFVLSDSVSSKAFFDAGLLGYSKPKMVFAQRIGLIRDIGKSYNYRDQRWEKGVSVLGVYEGNKFKNQNDGSYEVFSNGKKYIVAGLRISNTGADGEPLLVKAKIISDNLGDIKSADAVTYDDNGEVIPLSERFNPESNDIRFRTEYTPVVEIGRNGLSAFLEKKNSSLTDFIDDAWINYNSNKVDGSVAKQIIDMLSNGDTLNEAYLSVMSDIAAKPTLTEDEKAFATQSAEVLSAIAEEEISGNETLWAVYKEARKDKTGMFDKFADIKVGRNLGTETGIDPKESIVDYLTEAGKAEADIKTKHKALMALADALSDIRTAMRAQREYDRMTAQDMVTLSRLAIASGLLDDATRGEVKRLLGIVKRTIGMTKIRGRVDELYNLILDNCLRNVESYYKTAMKRKPVKVNKNGVVAQGALDIDGQRLMETYKDALDMPVDDDGSGRKTIADRMNEAFDRYNDEDETKAHEAEVDINALSLAKRYLTDVVASLAEEKDMKQSLESAKDALKKGQLTEEDYKQLIKETKACITTTKADRLKALSDITQNLLDFQKASRGAAAEFSARQKEHIAEIYRDAERDMEGRPYDENPQTPGLIQKIVGSQASQLFLAPLATFDMVFKMVGSKNAAGEGYLYNRFVRGWIDCSGAEQTNTESAFSELDEKVSAVFGKKMRWSDLYSVVRGMPQVECYFIDGGEKKSHMLTQGNLMYILLADNMEDGRMKLRNMGISEEDVEAIRKQMDPRFLELGRWVVDEFLPSRREAYNEVHMRMFGAPMSSVDNYFPLHILKGARTENVDVASANTEPVSPSTITGNIIKRTKNALALDVMGTDAFSAVIEHVQKMEHWRAFAEWNRDISTLLSNRKFRNRIVNMSSMYGYGEDLWKTFKDVCMVAAGSYSPKGVTKVDKSIMKIAKGVTAAKISLRVFTALKQFLSFPAYLSEANAEYLVKGIANPMKGWNWCMENLPLFRKRWLSRQAGDHILSTSEDWHSRLVENAARVGMSPNAFVDALTVSIGAYAIYQTKYRKYKDMGYSDEVADRRAKQDATISYNETQQSNENAFLSPMQMDRSYATAMLTVFRNSSMGYTRQVADAARNLKRRMDKGYREKSIAFMTEQFINDGLDPAKARRAARRMYARQGVKDVTRIAIFGYVMQFAWNLGAYGLYLLFGDDDDKKKEMLTDVAVHSLFGSIEGLSAGNVISELGNMVAMGESLNNYDPTLMPLMSDAKNVISEFSRDNVAAINSIVNLVVQMGLGVNPQTVEDMVLAIIDAAKGDPVVAQEALILGLRLIEAPQSQIEQIYLDEIQLSAVDAKKMTIPELAERYARYKTSRGATLTGWLYTDADKDEVMNKHIQNFESKAKERLTADMANQRYVQLEEDAKALENRVTLLRQKAIQGDEQASAELNDIFLSEDYGRALRFQEQQKLINAKAKEAVEAPTVDEMLTALADIDRMKKQLYDDFAGEESPSYLKDQYVQYTKGILAQMAKLDKKYETEYIQRNPEYEKMMAQYQKDLDNAANEAKSNRERITELEEEKLKYRKPGKKTYFPRYKNRVKEINDSIKVLRSRGTSAASIMSKVKKSLDVGEEAYMPSDILNSDEFRAYLAVKDLGSVSGNTFVFKEVADLEQKIKEAENPETKAKLAKRRDDLMGRMAQLVSRELNNVDDSDEVIE